MTDKQYYKLFGLEPGFTWEELCEAYQKVHTKALEKAQSGGKVAQFELRQVDEAYDYLQQHVYVEDEGIYHAPPKHPKYTDNRYVSLDF